MELKSKIDFAVVITAENCNPNGDPTMGNRPRQDLDGYGEMSCFCIKRKIRNRLQEHGQKIFVQTAERSDDGFVTLKERADSFPELAKEINKKKNADPEICKAIACKEWFDVRAFGQVFAFKGTSVSIGIRGPVSIGHAKTLEPIMICNNLFTKSVNTNDPADGVGRDSQTMGAYHVIHRGVYVAYGSIFPELAKKTGFSVEDSQILKEALIGLLENDASVSRPSGAMTNFLFWWEHDPRSHFVPSSPYFSVSPAEIPGVTLERY